MWRLASAGTVEFSRGRLFPGMTFTAQGKGVSHLVSHDRIFLTPDQYSETGRRKNIYWAVCVCECVLKGWTIITLGCQARGPQSLLPSSDVRGCVVWLGSWMVWGTWIPSPQGLCHLSWQKKLQM